MKELLKMILSLSLSGTLLIFVLLLCRPLVKDRISKRWQYYVWLIVIARLLLPFAPGTNLMGTLFQHFDNAVMQAEISLEPEQGSPVLPETDFADQSKVPGQVGSGDGQQLAPGKVTVPGLFVMAKQNIAAICLMGWFIVAACLLIRKITIYQSFVKYINAGRIEICDMRLWERAGELIAKAGMKGTVELYANRLISSPLLIGFFHPCIMLPTTELSETDFENTILHELTHYKRGDMFYKWLVQFTICVHWFNPAVSFMGHEISRACELSCDEAVIKNFSASEKHAYGDTLIKAMKTGGKYEDSLASVTLANSIALLKERLDSIMNFKKRTRWSICISLLLTVALVWGGSFSGAYAAVLQVAPAVSASPDIEPGGTINGKTVYFVYTEKGLRSIGTGKNGLDKFYMLANDIVLSSEEWVPIGTAQKPFTGTFNGNGCYIMGLTMTDPDAEVAGLFGYAQGATLHNIELREIDILSAGSNVPEKKVDSICAVPDNVTLTDNRVYPKISMDPNEETVMETFRSGEETYYYVKNETQLRAIGQGEYGLDKNYVLACDIRLSTEEWKPIGTANTPFTGTFNGNGYEIRGLTMLDPDAKVIGLFGFAEGAEIYHVTLRDYDIENAGKNAKNKSVSPVLVFGSDTLSYDNSVFPRQ